MRYFDKVLRDHIVDEQHFDKVIYPKKGKAQPPSGAPIGPTADTDTITADTNLYTADSY
jgi:hypothetical protein